MKPILFLFLHFCAIAVCAQDTKTEFYRRVYIDGRQHQIRLWDTVDIATTCKTNCYRVEFDKQDRIKTISYQKLGRWDMDENGFSFVKIMYSDSIEKRIYNFPKRYKQMYKDSSLISVRRVELILNKDKIPIALTNYNAAGNPTKDRSGVITYRIFLDENNRTIKCHFLDEHGLRTANNNDDYSIKFNWKQDENHYIPETSYYNQNDELHGGKSGYSIIQRWFDKKEERLCKVRFLNSSLQPVACEAGYAEIRLTYRKDGLLRTLSYYDVNGKPINVELDRDKNKYCRIELDYNQFGNITSRKCYKANEKKCSVEYKYIYDLDQNLIERKF